MLLGLDFDNTLICYDELFHAIATERSLLPASIPKYKIAVRDHLRATGQEHEWTRMQGEAYGRRISEARAYDGVLDTLRDLSRSGVSMCVVSHKTRTPYLGEPFDLHAAARDWLEQHQFFDKEGLGWSRNQVFFELTKEQKIDRILTLGCTHFLDDLPEILDMLPGSIRGVLFAPEGVSGTNHPWPILQNWVDLPQIL